MEIHYFLVLSVSMVAAWLPVSTGENVVTQMHVITRHGSRYPLPKDASTLQEDTPGTITPNGQRQHLELGQWFAEQYNSTGFFDKYHPSEVRLESSGFDRTLVSANSFALGAFDASARDPTDENVLFQKPANIPVYSIEPSNDIYFRAYDKCPTFHQRLDELYASTEWLTLEREHESLLRGLANLVSFQRYADSTGKIPLTSLWNVYDEIHVARTECTVSEEGFTPTCDSLPNPADKDALSDADFQELELLTSRVEKLRYGPENAERLLGGPMLVKIIDRMARHKSQKFFLYSAHYATILGVLSALNETFPVADTIPDYASALVFVLQQDTVTGKEYVQVIYKADSQDQTVPQLIQLGFCLDAPTCPLTTFMERWQDWTLFAWCKECNNQDADVCLKYWREEYEAENYYLEQPFLAGLLIGLGASAVLFVMGCIFCSPSQVKWDAQPEQARQSAQVPMRSCENNEPGESMEINDAREEPVSEAVMA